jgi:hypothetical protein
VLLAREGDQATATPAGVVFDSFAAPDWDQLFTNELSEVTFRATLRGPGITEANDVGLWQIILNQHGLIAREGSLFTVMPGYTRTIETLRYSEISSADDGEPHMTSPRQAKLVLGMTFTDGDHALTFAQIDPTCVVFARPAYGQSIRNGQALLLEAPARGVGPLTYRWKKDGNPLADGGRISGATSAYLSIINFEPGDAGRYTCVVTNPCRTLENDMFNVVPFCAADFDNNGGVDGGDVSAFFALWQEGNALADVNEDGGVDGGDAETFFRLWEAGGC